MPTQSTWASFVVYDDRQEDANLIRRYLQTLFQRVGLGVEVLSVTQPKDVRAALDQHPDFVICDISLSPTGDVAGLQLIQNSKKKYPHVTFVTVTMEYEKLKQLAGIVIQPDLILSKHHLILSNDSNDNEDDAYVERDTYVRNFFSSRRRQNRAVNVTWHSDVPKITKAALGWQNFDERLFRCLVRQVFRTMDINMDASHPAWSHALQDSMRLEEAVDKVMLLPIDQGESGSAVFKAIPSARGSDYPVSLVLKFCRISDFLQEYTNFSRYVKWLLPYSWRVDILGTGVSANVGVIAYSLAFSGSTGAWALSHYAREGLDAPVFDFIDRVFSPRSRTWYAAVSTNSDHNLRDALVDRYFRHRIDRYIGHLNGIGDTLKESELFFDLYGGRRGDPLGHFVTRLRRLLFDGCSTIGYQTCICHGDLHCKNIMVSGYEIEPSGRDYRDKHFAFIDFQDTGRWHIATDFVIFENSIRKDSSFRVGLSDAEYYAVEKKALSRMLEVGRLEVEPAGAVDNGRDSEYLKVVTRIRQSFFDNFEGADAEQYIFHMFVFAFFMLEGGLEARGRMDLVLAFFCASVDALYAHRYPE